jgi:glycosyltransferase involved in cell wall biosynthesis
MKLVFYMKYGLPHHKNWEGIQRMCNSYNIDFEYTNSIERIKEENYEILYCMCNFIDPYIIPPSIKIIYGPQLWVIPEPPMVGEYKKDLETRCVFNLLSQWVVDYVNELSPSVIMPTTCFPIAVNTDKFKPSIEAQKELDCIVYIKRRSLSLVNYTLALLNEKHIKYTVIRYGEYNETDYINLLSKTKFMITLDAHESQGFALQEAMSYGVPLLVMNATSIYDETNDRDVVTYAHLKPKKLVATSVPYWSEECGIKITNESELSEAIDKMRSSYNTFTPRDYVLRTLSANVCMKRILDYFGLVYN